MALRYAGAAAALLLVLATPIAAHFYRHNLKLPPAPVAMYPAPKPPADLPLWRDTQAASSPPLEETVAASQPETPRPPTRPKSSRILKRRLEAPEPNPAVASAKAEPPTNPAPQSAEQPVSSASAAVVPMTIEIAAQSTDGTVSVFADHQLIFSTALATVAEAAGEPFRVICTLIPGQHQLSVALYKPDNSLRSEKQGLAELRHGKTNLLAIRVVKHSKILLLRGTGLEVTWPTGSAPKSERSAKDFSAKVAASDE